MATGDYTFFIDSDYYLTKEKAIEIFVNKAKKDNLDIVMFCYKS